MTSGIYILENPLPPGRGGGGTISAVIWGKNMKSGKEKGGKF
jgi:hypothetical protein